MDENVAIKKAQKELEKISSDEHERYLAELREKYIMDQKATGLTKEEIEKLEI